MRTIVTILALTFLAPSVADAQLFGRRHCNTGHCFTPHVQKFVAAEPIIVQEQVPVTTFNIVNNVPSHIPLSPQGNSAYGYSAVSLANYAAPIDPTLLFNQASLLTQNAQDLASQGFTQYSTLAAQQLAGQVAVAKVQAQGQAAVAALQAAKAESTSTSTLQTFSFSAKIGKDGKMTVEPIESEVSPEVSPAALLSLVIENRCVRCHGIEETRGDFNLADGMTESEFKKAQKYVLGLTSKIMPPDNSPESESMTAEDRAAFLGNL